MPETGTVDRELAQRLAKEMKIQYDRLFRMEFRILFGRPYEGNRPGVFFECGDPPRETNVADTTCDALTPARPATNAENYLGDYLVTVDDSGCWSARLPNDYELIGIVRLPERFSTCEELTLGASMGATFRDGVAAPLLTETITELERRYTTVPDRTTDAERSPSDEAPIDADGGSQPALDPDAEARDLPLSSRWRPGAPGWAYTIIVGSYRTRAAAEESVDGTDDGQPYTCGVLESSRYRSLRSGFWVAWCGHATTESELEPLLAELRSGGFADAYTREIRR